MIKSIKLFIMLLGSVSMAQSPLVTGEIAPVEKDGLYLIPVPQKMRSYTTSNLSDLRIRDTHGNQVPYFVQPNSDYTHTKVSGFTEFPLISTTSQADSSSTYVFANPYKTIEKAILLIANYQGSKYYKLEGSNNLEQWFGLVNSGQLNHLNHPEKTTLYKEINFPLSTYKYLKIVFNDQHSLPINLLKMGMATTESVNMVPLTMEKIPVKAMDFLEKGNKTEIHIRFNRSEVINQIQFEITAPDLYKREAILYTIKEREVKRQMESYKQHIETLTIRSDQDLVFNVSEFAVKDLYIEIDNKDNPKLEITDIQLYQEPVYLVASLKAKKSYKVTAGDQSLKLPDYDISYAIDSAKVKLPVAKINHVIMEQVSETKKSTPSFWQQPWFMWGCIIVAGVTISFFAYNLMKDMEKGK